MSTEAKVGAFVILSAVVLGASIYFVHTTQTVRGQVPYKTYLRYAGGLAPGAAVLFGGIKVGQVTAVQPWTEDPTRIEIEFQVKTGTPINAKSMAQVGTVSIMSSPALSLSTGSNQARRLVAGEAVPSQEVVGLEEVSVRIAALADSAQQLMAQLQTGIQPLTRQAQALLANLNQVSGPTNRKHLEAILAQVDALMAQQSPKIDRITSQISELTKHVDSVVVSFEPLIANADRTVSNANATIDAVRDPLKNDLVELGNAVKEARMVLGSIQDVIGANESNISEAVQNLRSASENLNALSDTLNQRPWSLIRVTQPPDRKVPKK